MKETIKKSPYATFDLKPIKAENPPKSNPKTASIKGGDLRVKGAK